MILRVLSCVLLAVPSEHEAASFENPSPGSTDIFGLDTAVFGDVLVIGAPWDDDLELDAGSAFVFERTGSSWAQAAQLFASAGAPADWFGAAVSGSGDWIAVGANRADPPGAENAGGVYLFLRDGTAWTEQAFLAPEKPDTLDSFGRSLELDGDALIIGSPGDDGDDGEEAFVNNAGAAYVMRRNGSSWAEEEKLAASDASADDLFGWSVALSGDWAVAGAPEAGGQGAAYVFQREAGVWVERVKLVASDGTSGADFGHGCAIYGDSSAVTVAVGAPAQAPSGSGAVYVYRQEGSSWAETKLTPTNPHFMGQFGTSVAVRGNLLACGYPSDDAAGASDSGSVYAYLLSSGAPQLLAQFTPSSPIGGGTCGLGACVSGDEILAGAVGVTVGGYGGAGAAYLFDLFDTSPSGYCTGKTTSAGCLPFMSSSGVPSASSGPFFVEGNDHAMSQVGLLLYSFQKSSLDYHGGTLCVKAPIHRLSSGIQEEDGPCSSCAGSCRALRRNFNQWIRSGADPMLTAGQRVNLQWRQRDPGDPAGFGDNLSNGLSFVIGL
jgi:hypothetical protein